MNIIVGIVGEASSGKKTFTRYFKTIAVKKVSVSDYTDRATTCYGLLPLLTRDRSDVLLVHICSATDVEVLHGEFPHVMIIHVTANRQNRYVWFSEATPRMRISYDEFVAQESLPSSRRALEIAKRHRNYIVFNNDRRGDLRVKAHHLFDEVIMPLLRGKARE
jgi:hypothetical protein